MSWDAFFHDGRHNHPRHDRGIVGAFVIAILFAALAAASFAIDQTVSLSSLRETPAADMSR